MTDNYELSKVELSLYLTNEISPRQRCLNSLMTEVYKYLNRFSPHILKNVLTVLKHGYNTLNTIAFM